MLEAECRKRFKELRLSSRFIKEIADEKGKTLANNTEVEVKISLTHEDIAKLTATSRQTVTSILNELENSGIITYDRTRILIRDYKALA